MKKKNILDKKYNFLRPIKIDNLIRLGANKDGGYIVDSKTVDKSQILVSFGLGPQWDFELDYIKRNKNLLISVYDHTVSELPYLKEIWKYFRRYVTFRVPFKALKDRINYYRAYKNFLNSTKVKYYKEKITYPIKEKIDTDIKKVFSRIHSSSEVIMKSDIEGSEYDIIDQILEYSERIQMLIVEFHWIDKKEQIFVESVKKLQSKFNIIHIHGNNHHQKLSSGLPIVLEITLLNKKNTIKENEWVEDFPIKDLDFPNNPYLEDLAFSFRD